jgi:hypothetical protein
VRFLNPLITLLSAAIDSNADISTSLAIWSESIFTLITAV